MSSYIKYGIRFILIGFLMSCMPHNKLTLDVEVPDCVKKMIEAIKAEPVRNPPAEVWQWKTSDNIYYYVTSDCCDQYNYLYDEKCGQVCAPDGGFTGDGDGNCPSLQELIEKVLVWKDNR